MSVSKSPKRFALDGQLALVTGSSRGIGLASARALAEQGARVVINGRSAQTVSQAAHTLRQAGLDIIEAPFDAADIQQSVATVDRLIQDHGPIQIFMANAAMQHRENLLSFPQEKFEAVLWLNLTAQWALGRHLAAHMAQQKYGRIIVTGSITGLQGRKDISAYTVAKAGLHALARQWAVELSPHHITVNAVAPGYIATEFNQTLVNDKDFNQWLFDRVPQQKWGSPDDIANAVCYLASREASFVTGQTLAVDGGFTIAL
ncbi:MAG TPA: SDR family oxidoreductase [Advenella sp.]|nr:SDR family oxidoreductase [Advenella sp.]